MKIGSNMWNWRVLKENKMDTAKLIDQPGDQSLWCTSEWVSTFRFFFSYSWMFNSILCTTPVAVTYTGWNPEVLAICYLSLCMTHVCSLRLISCHTMARYQWEWLVHTSVWCPHERLDGRGDKQEEGEGGSKMRNNIQEITNNIQDIRQFSCSGDGSWGRHSVECRWPLGLPSLSRSLPHCFEMGDERERERESEWLKDSTQVWALLDAWTSKNWLNWFGRISKAFKRLRQAMGRESNIMMCLCVDMLLA